MRENSGEIEKITIADEDVIDWIQTLREGGFSDEEIDSMIGDLNEKYFEVKNAEYLDQIQNVMMLEVEKKLGRKLNEKDIEFVKDKARKFLKEIKSKSGK